MSNIPANGFAVPNVSVPSGVTLSTRSAPIHGRIVVREYGLVVGNSDSYSRSSAKKESSERIVQATDMAARQCAKLGGNAVLGLAVEIKQFGDDGHWMVVQAIGTACRVEDEPPPPTMPTMLPTTTTTQEQQEAEEMAKREAEEKARKVQERKEAEEAARLKKEQARKEAEERARKEAAEQARKDAEEVARNEQAGRDAEERARKKTKVQVRKKRKKTEEEARAREEEEKVRKEAEELARIEAKEKGRKEPEGLAMKQAEGEARIKTEELSRPTFLTDFPLQRTRRLNRKSVQAPSSGIPLSCTSSSDKGKGDKALIPYWDTLGSCRLGADDFSWGNGDDTDDMSKYILGFDKKLGRVYFSEFTLQGTRYHVGDFVARATSEGTSYFRIIAVYQATKSFLGIWGGGKKVPTEEIQKRGHPYMLVAPLYLASDVLKPASSKSPKKRPHSDMESDALVLVADHRFSDKHINILPDWLGEHFISFRKIQVRVQYVDDGGDLTEKVMGEATDPRVGSKGGKGKKRKSQDFRTTFSCHQVLTRDHTQPPPKHKAKPLTSELTPFQISLLTGSWDQLAAKHLQCEWNSYFRATQVQMMNETRKAKKDGFVEGKNVKFTYTGASSDDSDGFDED